MPDTTPIKDPSQGRPIWKFAYVLKNGHWCIVERTSFDDAVHMGKWCARYSIPFTFAPMSDDATSLKKVAQNLLSYLTCSYNALTDRTEEN